MSLLELMAVNFAVTSVLMVTLWLASLALRDVSIVDVFWGFGFIVIAGTTFFLTADVTNRKALLLALTATWGLRLTVYLARRKFGAPEDYRYAAMRDRIGSRFWIVSLAIVFGLQGVIMNVVALPLLAGQLDDSPLGWLDALGIAVWGVGFLFEAVGDLQLARFKADPQNEGKVLDHGLWCYTRHPNYFGNFMVWWGIFLASVGAGHGWWTIISPLLMSFLLLRVSGVTLLESSLRERKAGYAEYVARTSTFFPWPPRTPASDSMKAGTIAQMLVLALFLIICLGTAGLGAAWTNLSVDDWYATLAKPSWNPPNWIFGPVWTALYVAMAVAAWLVWKRSGWDSRISLFLFGVQLFLNAAWSGLFFGMRNPGFAFADIVLLWVAILATIVAFRRVSIPAALLFTPYLAWVSFAIALNWSIWRLNS